MDIIVSTLLSYLSKNNQTLLDFQPLHFVINSKKIMYVEVAYGQTFKYEWVL